MLLCSSPAMFVSAIPSLRVSRLRGTTCRHFQYISSSLLLDEKQKRTGVVTLRSSVYDVQYPFPGKTRVPVLPKPGKYSSHRATYLQPPAILHSIDTWEMNFNSRRTYKLTSPWLNLVPSPAICWRASINVEPKCATLTENFKTVSPVMRLSGLFFVFNVTQVVGRTI
jgi:hypothetical protein